MKNKVLIFIIVVLIVALGVIGVLYFKEMKNNANENNFLSKLNKEYPDSIGKHIVLNYAATTVYTEGDSTDTFISCFDGIYYYTGIDMGKLFIDDNEIKLNSFIKDICITTNYTDLELPTFEVGENYEFVSTMYILFGDGTLGKISTDDIKNKNYNISMLTEYGNIEHFVETEPIEHGGDTLLWAVDKYGNVYKIDTVGNYMQ